MWQVSLGGLLSESIYCKKSQSLRSQHAAMAEWAVCKAFVLETSFEYHKDKLFLFFNMNFNFSVAVCLELGIHTTLLQIGKLHAYVKKRPLQWQTLQRLF